MSQNADNVIYRSGKDAGIIDFYCPATCLGLYSRKTVAQLSEQYGSPLMVVTYEDAVKMDREASMSGPVEVSEKDYYEMLDMMPPTRYTRFAGLEMFCMSEPITLDIMRWYVRYGARFFKLNAPLALSGDEVKAMLEPFINR